MPDLGAGLVFYLVFLLSTTLHEAGHAWAALRGGDPTAYLGGQVSLDPRPHIRREPFGMVVLPLLSVALSGWPFGFASAPYNPRWAEMYPRRAGWMALAGPGANLTLMVTAAVAIRLAVAAGVLTAPSAISFGSIVVAATDGPWAAVAFFLSVVFSLNLLLAIFNLIPVPPLDGSAAVPLLLSDTSIVRYHAFLRGQAAFAWLGILVAWQVFPSLFQPVWLLCVNLLYPGFSYGG